MYTKFLSSDICFPEYFGICWKGNVIWNMYKFACCDVLGHFSAIYDSYDITNATIII